LENIDIFYGHLEYFTDIWDIVRPFGTLYVDLVHFSGFGFMYQEKSGNPARVQTMQRWCLMSSSLLRVHSLKSKSSLHDLSNDSNLICSNSHSLRTQHVVMECIYAITI
jgi:hypothetical protein